MCGRFSSTPSWGPGPQPRHVLWLGIELTNLWFAGQHSVHWGTPARACYNKFYLSSYVFVFIHLIIFSNSSYNFFFDPLVTWMAPQGPVRRAQLEGTLQMPDHDLCPAIWIFPTLINTELRSLVKKIKPPKLSVSHIGEFPELLSVTDF